MNGEQHIKLFPLVLRIPLGCSLTTILFLYHLQKDWNLLELFMMQKTGILILAEISGIIYSFLFCLISMEGMSAGLSVPNRGRAHSIWRRFPGISNKARELFPIKNKPRSPNRTIPLFCQTLFENFCFLWFL